LVGIQREERKETTNIMAKTDTEEEGVIETSEEKKFEVFTFQGVDVKLEVGSKQYNQLVGAIDEQKQANFQERRDMFIAAAKSVVDGQMDGFTEELDGQAFIYDFQTDKPVLVDNRLVKLGERVSKKMKEESGRP
tara:strand:- start:50 stop:454 length:405 start_codon:yes stop_codon:yes gene_type:complete